MTDNDFGFDLPVEKVQTDEVLLISLVLDASASMSGVEKLLNEALNDVIEQYRKSKAASKIMVSIKTFGDKITVLSGFAPIESFVTPLVRTKETSTMLNDALYESYKHTIEYVEKLEETGISTKSLTLVFTDGEDNASRTSESVIKDYIDNLYKREGIAIRHNLTLIGVGKDVSLPAKRLGVVNTFQMVPGLNFRQTFVDFVSQSTSNLNNISF